MNADATIPVPALEADLLIGPSALEAYSRLSYTMWHALAEFVDNSLQSRANYQNIIDDVLRAEGKPLQVDITYNKVARTLTVEDNSIGMTHERLVAALKVAVPTSDSRGKSRYGMGMKTAACWLGRKWQIVTCEWGSGIEWTATVDVAAVSRGGKVPVTSRAVDSNSHYTKIIVSDLRRNMQARTEETVKTYLSSMYMFELEPRDPQQVGVTLTYNADPIKLPDENVWDTDLSGVKYLRRIPEGTKIGAKSVSGYVGVLQKGSRKSGGFSLFQNGRQIMGYPSAWKPRAIFGGVDDEGANNLVAQRLTGVLELDSAFEVSHTKDAILFEDDEEQQLEAFLVDFTKDYRQRAVERRGPRSGKPQLSGEKFRELVESLRSEFSSNEMRSVVATASLPPIDAIVSNNQQRVAALGEDDAVTAFPISDELTIKVSIQEVSDYDPYVTISTGADRGVVYVLINGLHPYYQSLESSEAIEECITQFMYDAVAEYRARELIRGPILPDSVRNLKEHLMRVRIHQNESANFRVQRDAISALMHDAGDG